MSTENADSLALDNGSTSVNDIKSSPEKPVLGENRTSEKVKVACEYILKSQKKLASDNTLSGSELFDKAKKEFPEEFQSTQRNTFLQYLSNTVKDTASYINCLGKRKGYYISSTAQEVAENLSQSKDQSSDVDQKTARRQKEALLYPVLESWLIAQGYQSANVSANRSLGKWGNPDLAGINALDSFNGISVEVVTIEAKTSSEKWEQWIFEAISHRRFANRSYFAFAHPEEAISKIPQDMRYYAELYNIGVLVLSLENETFEKLMQGTLDNSLDSEEVDIVEIYSAPYNFVQPKYQIKFCHALGITCVKELYQWGNQSEQV
ncbi:MAG: hypothetical protein F6J87_10215 [Spirulina sp. SIO3F2]|nr:hypothetical protein [Spirulina sp. SIO3F2]